MHSLYADANELADKLKEARSRVVQISSELAQAEYDLAFRKAQVERGLIKKVGDEKKLGPTTEAREHIFVLARDADEEYLARLKQYNDIKAKLEQAQVEVSWLRDRLTIALTAMKADSANPT